MLMHWQKRQKMRSLMSRKRIVTGYKDVILNGNEVASHEVDEIQN